MLKVSSPSTALILFTIGHSTHSIEHFIWLLRTHSIEAIADVRSVPISRHNPQFDIDNLSKALKEAGIRYVFLGEELGARRKERAHYREGKIDYALVAQDPKFLHGLTRLKTGAQKMRIAIMCAEKDPLECHRTILVAKEAKPIFAEIKHILADGLIEDHRDAEQRLLAIYGLNLNELFLDRAAHLEDAYRRRAEEIAYQENGGRQIHSHG